MYEGNKKNTILYYIDCTQEEEDETTKSVNFQLFNLNFVETFAAGDSVPIDQLLFQFFFFFNKLGFSYMVNLCVMNGISRTCSL